MSLVQSGAAKSKVWACTRASLCACVRACVRVCVRAFVRACVRSCVRSRGSQANKVKFALEVSRTRILQPNTEWKPVYYTPPSHSVLLVNSATCIVVW